LACFKDDEEYVEPNTQEMIRAVRDKLNRFLSNFLENLKQSFIDLKKEVPPELHFLETLFEKISSSSYRKLFSSSINLEEGRMVEEIAYSRYLSNPTKEFKM
jgi:hypothetical protein